MNITTTKDKADRTVYTFTDCDALGQVAEIVFDLKDEVCRLSLNDTYVKLDSAAERRAWAAGVMLANRASETAMDALNILGTYLRAEKDDLAYLDEGLAARLEELPPAMRAEVGWMVDAIRKSKAG